MPLTVVDPRGRVPLTRHILRFEICVASATLSEQYDKNTDDLKSIILGMRASGMTYRQIGTALGIHWTRVGQIVKRN